MTSDAETWPRRWNIGARARTTRSDRRVLAQALLDDAMPGDHAIGGEPPQHSLWQGTRRYTSRVTPPTELSPQALKTAPHLRAACQRRGTTTGRRAASTGSCASGTSERAYT
jgi:hypothetical protein